MLKGGGAEDFIDPVFIKDLEPCLFVGQLPKSRGAVGPKEDAANLVGEFILQGNEHLNAGPAGRKLQARHGLRLEGGHS